MLKPDFPIKFTIDWEVVNKQCSSDKNPKQCQVGKQTKQTMRNPKKASWWLSPPFILYSQLGSILVCHRIPVPVENLIIPSKMVILRVSFAGKAKSHIKLVISLVICPLEGEIPIYIYYIYIYIIHIFIYIYIYMCVSIY